MDICYINFPRGKLKRQLYYLTLSFKTVHLDFLIRQTYIIFFYQIYLGHASEVPVMLTLGQPWNQQWQLQPLKSTHNTCNSFQNPLHLSVIKKIMRTHLFQAWQLLRYKDEWDMTLIFRNMSSMWSNKRETKYSNRGQPMENALSAQNAMGKCWRNEIAIQNSFCGAWGEGGVHDDEVLSKPQWDLYSATPVRKDCQRRLVSREWGVNSLSREGSSILVL